MGKLHINEGAQFVKMSENIAGKISKIMEVVVPTGTHAVLKNNTKMLLKLYKENGDEIDRNSKVVLALGQAREYLGTEFDDITYTAFFDKSFKEQEELENDELLRVSLKKFRTSKISLKGNMKLFVYLVSDDVIDPDKTVVNIELEQK